MGLAGAAPADAASAALCGGATTGLADHDVQAMAEAFLQALERVSKILPGVREGLEATAREGINVWVLTEASAERQRARIAAHGPDGLIRGVAEVTKSKEQFSRHQRRFAPRILYVIGDQPDRDVAPARAAGCRAVLVPSRFRPQWHEEAAWRDADNISETFDAAVGWVVSDLSERAPSPSRVDAR